MREDSHALAPRSTAQTVPVLVPTPAERPYSYAVPPGMAAPPGAVVRVPLGPRHVAGDRLGRRDRGHRRAQAAADRPCLRLSADPPRDAPLRRLGRRLYADPARHGGPHAACGHRKPSIRSRGSMGFEHGGIDPERLTEARRRVLGAERRWPGVDAPGSCPCRRRLGGGRRWAERARCPRADSIPAAAGRCSA